MSKTLNWKVSGLSGEGIMITGLIFSKICTRLGLNIFDYTEYPSIVTGGHNTYQVRASQDPVFSQAQKLDVLLVLAEIGMREHIAELTENSLVIFDSKDDKINPADYKLPTQKFFNLPMIELAKSVGGDRLHGNNVGLGASAFFLGLDLEVLKNVIADIFKKKGEEVIKVNQQAAEAGFNYAKENSQPLGDLISKVGEAKQAMTGNEAIALGAVAGGLKLYAAYPMTPSSSVLHYLAKIEEKAGIVVKHAEDEISSINMALGAAFTGVRAMTGTSGGGFAYMSEALGLAGVAELPLVVLESMRPGPALGMPTWTAQGDLNFALYASQDEFPRFVLTPGDAQEAFELSKKAQELAEKYQTLVILLSDKYLSESRMIVELLAQHQLQRFGFNNGPQKDETGFYSRFKDSDNGISLRSVPGQVEGTYIANSYEHDDYGLATEVASKRVEQVNKRAKKFKLMQQEIPAQYLEGDQNDELTLISFGSTKNPLRAAKQLLEQEGVKMGFMNLTHLSPFPVDQVKKLFSQRKKVAVIEGNSFGQLANLITQATGIVTPLRFNKYDGRPFYPEEIAQFVKENK